MPATLRVLFEIGCLNAYLRASAGLKSSLGKGIVPMGAPVNAPIERMVVLYLLSTMMMPVILG